MTDKIFHNNYFDYMHLFLYKFITFNERSYHTNLLIAKMNCWDDRGTEDLRHTILKIYETYKNANAMFMKTTTSAFSIFPRLSDETINIIRDEYYGDDYDDLCMWLQMLYQLSSHILHSIL